MAPKMGSKNSATRDKERGREGDGDGGAQSGSDASWVSLEKEEGRRDASRSKRVDVGDDDSNDGEGSESDGLGGGRGRSKGVSERKERDAAKKVMTQAGLDDEILDDLTASDLKRLQRARNKVRPNLLPPMASSHVGRKTLVLDLDETLVHSSFTQMNNASFVIDIEIEDVPYKISVAKRPGVDKFLQECSKMFEVVIFTASVSQYGNALMEVLDKGAVLAPYRLFRDSCVFWRGVYVKDLTKLGRDITKTIIIDNSPNSYILQPYNAIPVRTWLDDTSDRELSELLPILAAMARVSNVVDVIRLSTV